jgi:hypothetical protein
MAKGGPPFSRVGMFGVAANEQRGVEKYLFALPILEIMQDPVLINVSVIPLETNNIFEFILHGHNCIR